MYFRCVELFGIDTEICLELRKGVTCKIQPLNFAHRREVVRYQNDTLMASYTVIKHSLKELKIKDTIVDLEFDPTGSLSEKSMDLIFANEIKNEISQACFAYFSAIKKELKINGYPEIKVKSISKKKTLH